MTQMVVYLPDRLPFATYDVFTNTPFAGNPLAIVENAGGLTPQAMQIIAREFNLSETIFVQPPDDPLHTAKVRIFFPTAEIPFAGHPTIGCAIHLALKSAPEGDFKTEITLEELAGLVPVRVWREHTGIQAEFVAPVVPHARTIGTTPEKGLLAQALGISQDSIGFGLHQPNHWQGGPAFLYVPVDNQDTLASARPIEPFWSQAMALAEVDSAYLYTAQSDREVRARMFSPTAGIPEDPATGSASAILAAQLLSAGALPDGQSHWALTQGVEMGRPSQIGLTCHVSQGALIQVRVSGSAVPIGSGHTRVPIL